MSLSRAFTGKRTRPQISAPMPQRSVTTRQFASGTIRNKISAPVELLSTTNMLSYNAPDLYPQSSTSQSGDDSDSLPALSTSTTPSPDNSSADSSPPSSPEPNHLSCYFNSSGRQSTSSAEDAPMIPQRSSSHTKKSHEMLHRKRSVSRMSGKSSVSSFARESANMFSGKVEVISGPGPHPFGNELAQVTELVEEYGVQSRMQVIDEEEQELISKGLFKFDAEDYMQDRVPLGRCFQRS